MGIKTLVSLASSSSETDLEPLALALEDLGWRPREISDRRGNRLLSVGIGDRPQVLFVRLPDEPDSSHAVSLGYSHEARLAVDWRAEQFSIHSTSDWTRHPGDSPLAAVSGTDVEAIASLMYSLGRHTIARIEAPASRRCLPELLSDRFAIFRKGLRDADVWSGRPATDPFLFFHQLIFVRLFEDRHPALPPNRLDERMDVSNLETLLDWYQLEFDSDLFGQRVKSLAFPTGLIRDLIGSMTVPWQSLHLDFSVAEDDLAGRLYESYLDRAVELEERESQLFSWARFSDLKRESGAYYTPNAVAENLVEQSLVPWLDEVRPASPSEVRIIDPACGSGAFLAAAYTCLLRYFGRHGGTPLSQADRSRILEESLFGVDIDREALMLARLRLLELADLSTRPLPDLSSILVHGDALDENELLESGGFDIVLANPPFAGPKLASQILDTQKLRERHPSAAGTGSDLAYAFVDLSLRLMRDGGRAGLVLPRVALDGRSGAALRKRIDAARLSAVVDLGASRLFEKASAYVTLLSIEKSGDASRRVALRRIPDRGLSRDEVLELVGDGELGAGFEIDVPRSVLSEHASWTPFWIRWLQDIAPGLDGSDFGRFGDEGMPHLAIGTQIGDQRRFTFRPDEVKIDHQAGSVTIAGYEIPLHLAPWYIRGRNIRPFRLASRTHRVVVPRLGEDVQADDLIEALGGIPRSARPGRLDLLRAPKVLVRSLASEPAAVADFDGTLMPAQGGAGVVSVIPVGTDWRDLASTEALLNSAFYQWFMQGLGHPKSGAVQLMRHHYALLPWPALSDDDVDQLAGAGEKVRQVGASESASPATYWDARRNLDKLVYEVLAVSSRVRDVIDNELWREP